MRSSQVRCIAQDSSTATASIASNWSMPLHCPVTAIAVWFTISVVPRTVASMPSSRSSQAQPSVAQWRSG